MEETDLRIPEYDIQVKNTKKHLTDWAKCSTIKESC